MLFNVQVIRFVTQRTNLVVEAASLEDVDGMDDRLIDFAEQCYGEDFEEDQDCDYDYQVELLTTTPYDIVPDAVIEGDELLIINGGL